MGTRADEDREEIERLRRENAELRRRLDRARTRSEGARDGAEELILASATGYAILTLDPDGRITEWNEGARLITGWDPAEVMGRDGAMLFTPEQRAAGAPEQEKAAALARGRAEDERWHLRKDGSRFWASGLMMPLRSADEPARGYLKILRDRTEELHAARNERRRLDQMKALAEAARAIVGASDLDATLRAITDSARRIVGAHRAACTLTLGPDRSQTAGAVSLSDDQGRRDVAALPEAAGLHGWVGEGHRTLRMTREEIEAHPRRRDLGLGSPGHPAPRGWLAAALLGSDGRSLGLIQLSDKEDGGAFDEVDEAIAVQVAQLAASAIERTQAEAQLRESEAELRLLADALPVLVSVLDRDQRYRFMNRAHERWFGRPRQDLLGRTIREVLGQEAHAQRRAWIDAVLRGDPVRFEAVTPASTGARRDTEVHYLPRHGADGSVDGFYGVVVDLTEQKAAQRAVQEARDQAEREAARTGAILSQLAEGVIVTDAAGRITFVNEAAARIHGMERLEVAPPDYGATYHLHTLEGRPYPSEDLPLARAAIRGETLEDVRWIIRRPDGREVVAVGGARPILTPAGEQVGAVLTVRDDTARAQAEARLRRLNRDLEAEVAQRTAERDRIWHNSSELMGVFGFDGMRWSVNPAWTQVLGWDEETLLAMPFQEITHPEDMERLAAAVERLRRGERVEAFEDRLRHKDGSWRTVSWTGVPGEDAFYAIGRDVTEQRIAEEALRQSQKMEAVGQLTGGIAHDFNNLLAGIMGSLDLLRTRLRQGRPEAAERYLDAATTSAERAAALTHRLLAFSRRQPLDPRPVEANRLIAGMEELLRRTLGPAIALELRLAGDLWRTLCDPVQLESAILNLCINARDAMPDGGRLTVETGNAQAGRARAGAGRDMAAGPCVTIAIADSGTGMPPEVRERVFEPFFTTKPIGQGTGLGLSMVYGFARQSGGHVGIDSEEGRGTTVTLSLPRHRGGADRAEAEAGPVEPTRAGPGETVLVVEDEPVVRSLIVEVLEDLGFRALAAPDGPSGLRLLDGPERIDLLVTDVGLPGLNGRQLADQARVARPGLKVLFVTGYAEGATLAQGFLAPGMAMLTKPFSLAALVAKIREAMGG